MHEGLERDTYSFMTYVLAFIWDLVRDSECSGLLEKDMYYHRSLK